MSPRSSFQHEVDILLMRFYIILLSLQNLVYSRLDSDEAQSLTTTGPSLHNTTSLLRRPPSGAPAPCLLHPSDHPPIIPLTVVMMIFTNRCHYWYFPEKRPFCSKMEVKIGSTVYKGLNDQPHLNLQFFTPGLFGTHVSSKFAGAICIRIYTSASSAHPALSILDLHPPPPSQVSSVELRSPQRDGRFTIMEQVLSHHTGHGFFTLM